MFHWLHTVRTAERLSGSKWASRDGVSETRPRELVPGGLVTLVNRPTAGRVETEQTVELHPGMQRNWFHWGDRGKSEG